MMNSETLLALLDAIDKQEWDLNRATWDLQRANSRIGVLQQQLEIEKAGSERAEKRLREHNIPCEWLT